MKKIIVGSVFALSAFGADWTGFIADSKCGLKGAKAEHKQCAEGCIKAGASPVLVADGKVYAIANPDKVKDHVGEKVTVTGSANRDTVTVSSITAAQ
jgi:hypothetical protein